MLIVERLPNRGNRFIEWNSKQRIAQARADGALVV